MFTNACSTWLELDEESTTSHVIRPTPAAPASPTRVQIRRLLIVGRAGSIDLDAAKEDQQTEREHNRSYQECSDPIAHAAEPTACGVLLSPAPLLVQSGHSAVPGFAGRLTVARTRLRMRC